jgi:hypothetical protein
MTVAAGVDFASSLGLNPVVEVGEGEHSVPMIRNPITFSRTPPRYTLPPPALGQDSEQVRAWLSDPALVIWTDQHRFNPATESEDHSAN